ncbi:MAG: hypothetical protein NTV15_05865 [Candidatus Bathyarchaeota archaeon]|nr:hypothetical protein [Candidatus Bathyarchaeota archaeon]
MSDLTAEMSPRIFDYLAAGILANGLVYFWQVILSFLPGLEILSILIFLAVGFVTSWLVLKRASKQHLKVGAIAGVASWVITIFMMFGLQEGPNSLLIIVLFGCFLVGGLGAAYYSLKQQIKEKAKVNDAPNPVPGNA